MCKSSVSDGIELTHHGTRWRISVQVEASRLAGTADTTELTARSKTALRMNEAIVRSDASWIRRNWKGSCILTSFLPYRPSSTQFKLPSLALPLISCTSRPFFFFTISPIMVNHVLLSTHIHTWTRNSAPRPTNLGNPRRTNRS